MLSPRRQISDSASLALLLLVTGLIYWPGTGGIFLLDDVANLGRLSTARPENLPQLLSHAMSGISGVSRILPELSFILQADAWPTRPEAMIRVNLALHLCNGILVYSLLRIVLPEDGIRRKIAFIATAIWLLSPIQVAGTLYIVQRINQMSTLFVLVGLLGYAHGRHLVLDKRIKGWFWMGCSVVGGTVLASLSKENGVLLPLLILVCEATLWRELPWPPGGRYWRHGFLHAPLLAVLAVIAWRYDLYVADGYARRDFTLGERLLTQGRVLLDYLQAIVLPRGYGLGIFHDDYPVARGSWIDYAYLTITLLVVGLGWQLRRHHPVFAFAVLWFFAGHVIESTFLPLELYFEHRNYLPLLGPAVGLAWVAASLVQKTKGPIRISMLVLAVAWLVVMVWTTHQQARIWGNPPVLAEVAAHEHPGSHRALLFQAAMLDAAGFKEAAANRYERIANDPANSLQWLLSGCDGRMSRLPDIQGVSQSLATGKKNVSAMNTLALIADAMEENRCPMLSPELFGQLVHTLLMHDAYRSSRRKLEILYGRALMAAGRYGDAVDLFAKAFADGNDIEASFLRVKSFHAAGQFREATAALTETEQAIRNDGLRAARYIGDLERWRRQLMNDSQEPKG